jgi:hypothetical protein
MTLPLTANELYRYGKWLGKGVYYIQHGELLAPDQPIWVDLVGQEEVNFIKGNIGIGTALMLLKTYLKTSRFQI